MFEAILNLERREHQPKINYPHAASVQQIMIIVKISQPPVHCVYLTREIAGAWELFGCDSPDGAATIYHDYFAPIVSAAARRRNASSIKRPLAKREGSMRLNGKAAIARTEPSRLPG